jgi:hypothetical protein
MPTAEYEHRTDSVLAWKRNQKLGRFDPDAPSIEQQKIRASEREVEERGKHTSFSVHQSVGRTVVAREKTNQNYSYHRRGCSCSPQLLFQHQHANRRCFKRSPKWTVAYLPYHDSIADTTSRHRRIQAAASCHPLQAISSYQATSYPESSCKSPYRASCIQPLVKLKRTLMAGTMASNAFQVYRLFNSYYGSDAYASVSLTMLSL